MVGPSACSTNGSSWTKSERYGSSRTSPGGAPAASRPSLTPSTSSSSARFPNADAYQMLAYCAGLGQERGFLVYARDVEQRSRTHRIRDGRATIEIRAVDLEATPDEVLQQVENLAQEVARSSSGNRQSDLAAAA
jgi:hypothetical protein